MAVGAENLRDRTSSIPACAHDARSPCETWVRSSGRNDLRSQAAVVPMVDGIRVGLCERSAWGACSDREQHNLEIREFTDGTHRSIPRLAGEQSGGTTPCVVWFVWPCRGVIHQRALALGLYRRGQGVILHSLPPIRSSLQQDRQRIRPQSPAGAVAASGGDKPPHSPRHAAERVDERRRRRTTTCYRSAAGKKIKNRNGGCVGGQAPHAPRRIMVTPCRRGIERLIRVNATLVTNCLSHVLPRRQPVLGLDYYVRTVIRYFNPSAWKMSNGRYAGLPPPGTFGSWSYVTRIA